MWDRVLEVLEWILAEGAVLRPITVTPAPGGRGLVVLDGHHRLTALRLLGAVRAPVLVVDYWRHVDLSWWRREPRPSRREVLEAAVEGRLYPPKTTRHRLLVAVEAAPTPLEALLVDGDLRGPGARGVGAGASCRGTRGGRRG